MPRLLDAETLIVVNHTVRLAGLKFAQAKGGPQERRLRMSSAMDDSPGY